MWGAYGNKPLDMDQRPPVDPSNPSELCPMVCGIWSTYQQFFSTARHKFSNDGLAYIADRGNKRVQVFTPEGKFVAEQFHRRRQQISTAGQVCGLLARSSPAISLRLRVSGHLHIESQDARGSWLIQHRFAARDPPGHLINVDHEGNVYAVQAELSGADGHSGGAGRI